MCYILYTDCFFNDSTIQIPSRALFICNDSGSALILEYFRFLLYRKVDAFMKRISYSGNQLNKMSYVSVSSDMLKWIAVVVMCIDHLAVVVLKGYVNTKLAGIPREELGTWELFYNWMRDIGRIAFPLFAFLLVEGFYHTKNRKKYGARLLVTAILSEIPYDLAVYGQVWSIERQNTIFSLFLGFVSLCVLAELRRTCLNDGWDKKNEFLVLFMQVAVVAVCGLLAYVCRVDYTWRGILLIAVFYFFYGYRSAAAVSGFCVFSNSPWSAPAFLLIPFYNGKRSGKGRGFYLFYPIHLLILWGMLQILLL